MRGDLAGRHLVDALGHRLAARLERQQHRQQRRERREERKHLGAFPLLKSRRFVVKETTTTKYAKRAYYEERCFDLLRGEPLRDRWRRQSACATMLDRPTIDKKPNRTYERRFALPMRATARQTPTPLVRIVVG